MVVDAAHYFLGVPGGADLTVGVASIEQPEEACPAAVVESFIGSGQQAPGSIEGVDLAASMSEGVVLHPTADLVEALVGQPHEMERVSDRDGGGQHGVENCLVRAGQIEGDPGDLGQPARTAPGQPGRWSSAVTAFDHIKQSSAGHVDEGCGPPLVAIPAGPAEQCLVQADRGGGAYPIRVVIDERFAV